MELENDREARLQELQDNISRAQKMQTEGYGKLMIIENEKNMLEITTKEKRVVAHFFEPGFLRCKEMTRNLAILAKIHKLVRFIECHASKMSFIVEKLKILVLPCVLMFIDGICVSRIVGFEGLGGDGQTFKLSMLELQLWHTGIIEIIKIYEDNKDTVKRKNIPVNLMTIRKVFEQQKNNLYGYPKDLTLDLESIFHQKDYKSNRLFCYLSNLVD